MLVTIFKIIGILLLIIVSLFILALLLVFFWPVKYRAKGNFDCKEVHVQADISWFFKAVTAVLEYDDIDTIKVWYRILFWKKDLFDDESYQDETMYDTSEVFNVINKTDEDSDVVENTKTDNKQSSNAPEQQENCEQQAGHEQQRNRKQHTKHKRQRSYRRQILRIFSDIKGRFLKIRKLLSDKSTKSALSHLKQEIFLILKRICPQKLKLDMKFAAGEPDKTGMALGIIAAFPIGYKNRWQISPDFESEKAYAIGEFNIKGRIYIFRIIGAVIRIVLDKDCRKLYNKIMN